MRRSRMGDGGSPTGPRADKACPPALSSGKCAMSGGSMQKTFHEAMRQRRTSLPANSLTFGKMQNVQTSNVSEARGLVVDMLANRDLPPNVVSCLRAVATLLNPHTPLSIHSLNDFGLPCVVENPYSGEQLIVSNTWEPFKKMCLGI
ncbi:hypothetical protein Y032_0037g3508 [Ancylostoma ceylanicum]|nr:hypothetical protein Y032_0037g3508 [Ancylostoma ceylanicum]